MIHLAKVHDLPSSGTFVLVDRLWPRGVAKSDFTPDLWPKGAAPSSALRKAFHSGELDFPKFASAYRVELDAALSNGDKEVQALLSLCEAQDVILVFASKNLQKNHAHVLRDWLLDQLS
ncbi:DUF488 family protein [Staphylococcus chromogenes]|nr:DUF488 family protein [Staphylococcus chromogenes]